MNVNEILFYTIKCLKNFSNFNGRARRKEYWMFALAYSAVAIVLAILSEIASLFNMLSWVLSVLILVPGLAVGVRRLHDIGKSGKMLLLIFVPIIGWAVLVYWACQPGQAEENQYGLNPKDTPDIIPEIIKQEQQQQQ